MIEFSQQTVSGDAWETGLALFILFIFAIIASGYVLKEGLRKKEKTTHEILLKCVIIITSVVPRQFPMQVTIYLFFVHVNATHHLFFLHFVILFTFHFILFIHFLLFFSFFHN